MRERLMHEALYRSADAMRRLETVSVVVCGAGAVGANLVETLTRVGFGALTVIDRDRVEARNLSTQPWGRRDVGQLKARVLSRRLYRELGLEVRAVTDTLTAENASRLLRGADVVVDAFDNAPSRRAVTEACGAETPCLHVGLSGGYAEVIWNPEYRIPSANQDDICDYPLARNLVLMAVSIAAETLITWVVTKLSHAYTLTLADVCVQRFPPNR